MIDLEEGSQFVDALKYDVIGEARAKGVPPIVELKSLIEEIAKANKEKGGYVYPKIAVDTTTALEEIVLLLANKMYKSSPQGKNWIGTDVTTLPNGAGYLYTRKALSKVINELESICDTLILLGHVKDKDIEKRGETITERSLALTGKSSSILCSQVDAVGYVAREENETIIDFKASPNFLCGARSPHLKDKKITVAVSDEAGNLKIDWSQVFVD